jgi:hypothetical protein
MGRGAAHEERLDKAPFLLRLPRRGPLLRFSIAAALVCLAVLILLVGGSSTAPARPAAGCPASPATPPRPSTPVRPVPPAGTVGVPLTLPSASSAAVLRSGDRVDVLATVAGQPGTVLAESVLVLSVRSVADLGGDTALYVAASPRAARRLAGAAPDTRLAVTVRPP